MKKKIICLIIILILGITLLGCTEPDKKTFEECMNDCVKTDTPKNCTPLCTQNPNHTNKPNTNSFCGNNICDEKELQNPRLCPKDCDITLAGTQYNCENGNYNEQTGYCEINPGTNYLCTNGTYDPTSGYCIIAPDTQIICNQGYYNEQTQKCEIIINIIEAECSIGIYDPTTQTCIYDPSQLTCEEQNGTKCTTNQTCSGNLIIASNTDSCCNATCNTVEVSVDYDKSPFGYLRSTNLENYINDLGVKWVRASAQWGTVQPTDDFVNQGNFDWDEVEESMNIKEYQENGAEMLITISQLGVIAKGAQSYIPDEPPYTIDTWKSFAKAVVERYDGDGINDSPNLIRPIKYFQVENEPKNVMDGFAELQRVTYQAIKEACPDCKVLIGGVQGINATKLEENAEDILAELNGNYIDILDMHYWESAMDYKMDASGGNALIRAKELLDEYGFTNVPIWVTETGTHSGDPNGGAAPSYQTETEQAASLLKRYVYLISHDVEKIFYAWGLYEGLRKDCSLYDFTGLIYDGQCDYDLGNGVKKLGYYTYKKMTETLEGSDWENIEVVQESNNIYIYKFVKNNKSIWVVWNDGAEQTININIGNVSSVTITEAVPKYTTGQQVNNYQNAFTTQTQDSTAGTINLLVKDIPIFIEQN